MTKGKKGTDEAVADGTVDEEVVAGEAADVNQAEGAEQQSTEEVKEEPPKEVTIWESELEALKGEAAEYKDKYWRLLAETENARKRMQKERDDNRRFAIRDAMLDVLHPLDHLEQALAHSDNASDDVKHWAVGFKMILTQFKDVLDAHNVKPFDALGHQFDPHLHDAVEMIETEEHPDGEIVQEMLKGYTIGDRTLRPARVKVAKAPVVEEESAEEATIDLEGGADSAGDEAKE